MTDELMMMKVIDVRVEHTRSSASLRNHSDLCYYTMYTNNKVPAYLAHLRAMAAECKHLHGKCLHIRLIFSRASRFESLEYTRQNTQHVSVSVIKLAIRVVINYYRFHLISLISASDYRLVI